MYMFRTKTKRFLGQERLSFSYVLSFARLLWLLPVVMPTVASPLHGARDVNAVNSSCNLGSLKVTRRWNVIFEAGQECSDTETCGRDDMKDALKGVARERSPLFLCLLCFLCKLCFCWLETSLRKHASASIEPRSEYSRTL